MPHDGCLVRNPGARHSHALRRAARRNTARRLRRRSDQDRAPQGRPGAQPRRAARRRRPLVEDARPRQEGDDALPRLAGGAGPVPRDGRRRRRGDRELPARHPGAVGPRLRRVARDQPAAGADPGHRLRAVRSLLQAAGVRHARRGDERIRRHHRRAGRATDAAPVRPGRRDRGADHGVRRDDRAARPRCHRRGPGRRHGDHRADPHPARPADHHLRPARRAPGAHRQPVQQQRAAQHLPDQRRPVGRDLHQRAVDRRAGDAAGGLPS